MRTHYCDNCHHWSPLIDNVYCNYCLRFWQDNRRMPLPGDVLKPTTGLESLYATMGWEMPK